jgi:hypothetical protein
LVGVWPESIAGAPEPTRERLALRCLQEAAAVSAEGEVAAGAGAETLRVEATRSCEEFLLELIGRVRSPFVTSSISVVQNFRFVPLK